MKRPKLVSLRNNILALLLCALMLPPVTILLVAAFAHFSQERAMEIAVSSYVRDLAESTAYRFSAGHARLWEFRNLPFSAPHYSIFSMGPSIPGWVAYVNDGGQVIISSPTSNSITMILRESLPVGQAIRMTDEHGRQYTLAAHPVQGGGYILAAVSWDELLGNLVWIGRLWPILIVLVSLCSFMAIRLLWHCLISPLKNLASEIDGFRVGKDLPKELDSKAVREIESVHSALTRFAQAAIDRDNLRNYYIRDIVHVQETERMDMAREIHDGPLQDITALLQQIHMVMEEGGYSPERVKKTEQLAKFVVRELRGMCDELSPPWLDLGLSKAITELAERLSQNYDIQISVDMDGRFEPGEEKTLSLLRIFQEAVSNAVRHGSATEVHAGIRDEEGRLFFEIKDNGKGFNSGLVDYQALRLKGHRGLANMTERMLLMGGTFEVRSVIGEGTSIICVLNGVLPV
jgi:signal transduction histidine kinase